MKISTLQFNIKILRKLDLETIGKIMRQFQNKQFHKKTKNKKNISLNQ